MTKEQYRKATGKKKNKKKNRAAIVLTCLFLCAVAVFCVLSLTVLFKTEFVKVEGNKVYTDSQIVSASKIKIGDNLIRISEEKVSKKLSTSLPFVKSVKIKRDFPSTAVIVVEETKEEIFVKKLNKYYSADMDGKILKEYSSPSSDKAIVFEVSKDSEVTVGKQIGFKNDREKELFEKYINIVKSKTYEVNFVSIEGQYDSYMLLEDRMVVKFGSASYFDEKLGYFKSGYTKIPTNSEGVFDLSSWTPESNVPRFRPQSIEDYKK